LLNGQKVSFHIIHNLYDEFGLGKRQYQKSTPLSVVENRNEQFEYIATLKQKYKDEGLPILSIDTKKKELLGNFHRKGTYYDKGVRKVFDHDFPSFSEGKVVPHGIYDVIENKGYLTLGISADTSEFVVDNLEYFWQNDLKAQYATATSVLILCDGGGSNSSRHYIVKEDLVGLAQVLELDIVIAHYPPYCSKWNPIEHRMFAHIHRAWEGELFQNLQIVKELAEKTSTKNGLNVKVNINQNQYLTKRKYQSKFKENIETHIDFDKTLPQWNYTIKYKNNGVIN
jgi:Rhodopirellula transposase DDE domain